MGVAVANGENVSRRLCRAGARTGQARGEASQADGDLIRESANFS